jgi:hypothetical protein
MPIRFPGLDSAFGRFLPLNSLPSDAASLETTKKCQKKLKTGTSRSHRASGEMALSAGEHLSRAR